MEEALKLYNEAIDAFETEDKEFMANDIYRSAVLSCMKQEKYALAVPMLLRMAAANQKASAHQTVSRVCAFAGGLV